MDTKNIRLKVFRNSLNITQEDMAAALGIKRAAYSNVENGVNNLTVEHLTVLFTKYNLNPIWYLIGAGNMKIDTQDMMQFFTTTGHINVVQENATSKLNSPLNVNQTIKSASNENESSSPSPEVEIMKAKLEAEVMKAKLEAADEKNRIYEAHIKNLQEMIDFFKNSK